MLIDSNTLKTHKTEKRSHTHEQVVGLRTLATDFKQLLEVMKLTVNVSADLEEEKEERITD